jgi:hypothetical protein
LDDLAIITWMVPADALREHLPEGLEPLEWNSNSGPTSLISMVAFRDRGFRFNFCPIARLSGGQVNYRAYVRRGGLTGVWFFGTSLDHRLVGIPRTLWRMPWHRDRVAVAADWDGGQLHEWSLRADGDWGSARVLLRGRGDPGGGDGPFNPPVHGVDIGRDLAPVLVDPQRGWFRRTDGLLGRYSVSHPPMSLLRADVLLARTDVFSRLGLVPAEQAPVDARVTGRIRFDVHTPPRRVPGPSRG